MKRAFLIIAILSVLLLCACSRPYHGEVSPDSDEKEVIWDTGGTVLYVVNTQSRSYHLPSCYQADRIKDENRAETQDINFLTKRCYTPCKICIGDRVSH
ncbi:MAG: hypothetical protein J6A90_05890 [Clostridia bacterium]|nr:hypothetical protein [Clostridia bacterium]